MSGLIDAYAHCGLSKYKPLSEVEQAMQLAGVDRAVLVQHLGEFDNTYIQQVVADSPYKFSGVLLVDHEQQDASARLHEWEQTGHFRGVRFLLEGLQSNPALWQAAVDREQPDLVLMGKQAVDDDAGQTGQILAALLDWPQATFASKIEFVEDTVRVARETDAGIEVVRVGLPAVITTDLRLNEPRYVSLPSMLKAKNKPIEWVNLQDQNIAIQPRIQILRMETTATGRNCERVASVEMLIDRLRNEAKVI